MSFKELAKSLGIEAYPEKFDEIFENLREEKTSFCDLSEIEAYDREFSVSGEYSHLVKKAAEALLKNKDLYVYGRTICDYIKVSTPFEARHVPIPKPDGTLERDFFGVLIIFYLLPESVAFYRRHGFTNEEIAEAYSGLKEYIKRGETTSVGRPYLSMSLFNWTLLYVYGEMFKHDGFNYQFRDFFGGAVILKNRATGEHIPMMTENRFHRNGQVLGSAGATDEEGSFDAEFEETDEAFVGHLVIKGRVSSDLSECKKTEWECVLRPGDEVMAVHIPKGTNLAREEFIRSFKGSFEVAKGKFPERNPKFLVCFSWLMDTTLAELTEPSKIAGFGNAFLRFPLLSDGKEFRHWVFPKCGEDNKKLPEDTSLQRKLKTLTLAGGYIYYTAGVCTEVLKP